MGFEWDKWDSSGIGGISRTPEGSCARSAAPLACRSRRREQERSRAPEQSRARPKGLTGRTPSRTRARISRMSASARRGPIASLCMAPYWLGRKAPCSAPWSGASSRSVSPFAADGQRIARPESASHAAAAGEPGEHWGTQETAGRPDGQWQLRHAKLASNLRSTESKPRRSSVSNRYSKAGAWRREWESPPSITHCGSVLFSSFRRPAPHPAQHGRSEHDGIGGSLLY